MLLGHSVIGQKIHSNREGADMQTYLRDQVDWPQAFPAEEYAERRAKVCRALADAGLDAIYITAPANITWLTGLRHDRLPPGDPDRGAVARRQRHTTIVSTTPRDRRGRLARRRGNLGRGGRGGSGDRRRGSASVGWAAPGSGSSSGPMRRMRRSWRGSKGRSRPAARPQPTLGACSTRSVWSSRPSRSST